jgi:LPXTG-motif cell wall-anchored protein
MNMFRSKRGRVLSLGASLAATALVLAPVAPAHAEEAPSFTAYPLGNTLSVASTGGGKVAFIAVNAHDAVNPVLTIDFSALKVATVVPLIDECKASGTKVTCTLPDGSYGDISLPVQIKAAAGAKEGQEGTYAIGTKADNVAARSDEAKVKIVDGVDLVAVNESEGEQPAKPGDVVWMPATIVNEGNEAAPNPVFTFFFDYGLVPDEYQGCTYGPVGTASILVTCPLGEPLGPGDGVSFVTDDGTPNGHPGMAAKVTGDAYGSIAADLYADPGTDDQSRALAKLTTRKVSAGKKYSVKATQAPKDTNEFDNWSEQVWNVGNRKDVATHGATATGKVGDVVKVTIGIKNNGPAGLNGIRSGGEPTWEYDFVVPDGTEVVSAPQSCWAMWHEGDGDQFQPGLAGKRFYACFNYDQLFLPGETSDAEFGLKITQVIPNATGTVSFTNQFRNPAEIKDDNPANDLSEVVINPNPGGGGGGLPLTGAKTATVAGAGALLLVGGAALFMMARRRRVVLVTPKDGGAE